MVGQSKAGEGRARQLKERKRNAAEEKARQDIASSTARKRSAKQGRKLQGTVDLGKAGQGSVKQSRLSFKLRLSL